jgi:aspartate aminotransferase
MSSSAVLNSVAPLATGRSSATAEALLDAHERSRPSDDDARFVRRDILRMRESQIEELWRLGCEVGDLIGLWTGEVDLSTPSFICEAASRALFAGKTFYSHTRGLAEFRSTVTEYHRRHWGLDIPEDRIALTLSGMNAVMLIAQATLRQGDNVVAITPCWPNIVRAAQICGAEVRQAPLGRNARGWFLDLDRTLAACNARTRLIYLASPGNPTGWTIEPHEAEAIMKWARLRGVAVLADEVYHRLVYDRDVAFSFLEAASSDDGVFVVNSFSKAWAMSGWRLGWMVYPPGCRDVVEKLIQFNTCGGLEFLQAGAISALGREGDAFVESVRRRCCAGRDFVNDRLQRMPGVRCVPQQAGYYTLFGVEGVDDTMTFCRRAVAEARLGMAPGEGFGAGAEGLIRLCFAKSSEALAEAMDRLERFIRGSHSERECTAQQ